MRALKTYGINGLLEWHGNVHCGGSSMKVDFTNGSTTAYGVSPATFMTKDVLTQQFIENSDEYKGGRIRTVSITPLPGGEEEKQAGKPEGEAAWKPEGNASGTTAEEAQHVKVSDKAEAVEWLKEHYPEKGYTGVKLRSKEAFEAACKECGVEFDIQG